MMCWRQAQTGSRKAASATSTEPVPFSSVVLGPAGGPQQPRLLRAAGHVDVLHLRMADVGSLAYRDPHDRVDRGAPLAALGVTLTDRREFRAKVLGSDEKTVFLNRKEALSPKSAPAASD